MFRRRSVRLLHRVMAFNAVILVTATLLLLFSPITISAPVEVEQAALVMAGLLVMLGANGVLLHQAFRPLDRLVRRMDTVDLLRPGQRLDVEHSDEVGGVVAAFNDMLDRLETERRRSGRRLLAAQEAERGSIARDLHDEVGQLLTAVLLQLEATERDGDQSDLEPAKSFVRRALDEVRRISRELRPEMLEDLGLISALTELTSTFERLSGSRVQRSFDPDLPPLDADTELAIYRIVQESLTNIARHAASTTVHVVVERFGRGVAVSVRDDGIGVDASDEHGAGLRNMRERALLVGGVLAIRPGHTCGTEVRLEVPA